jgi:hypothetical protein
LRIYDGFDEAVGANGAFDPGGMACILRVKKIKPPADRARGAILNGLFCAQSLERQGGGAPTNPFGPQQIRIRDITARLRRNLRVHRMSSADHPSCRLQRSTNLLLTTEDGGRLSLVPPALSCHNSCAPHLIQRCTPCNAIALQYARNPGKWGHAYLPDFIDLATVDILGGPATSDRRGHPVSGLYTVDRFTLYGKGLHRVYCEFIIMQCIYALGDGYRPYADLESTLFCNTDPDSADLNYFKKLRSTDRDADDYRGL